jgi:hypothetical protein
MRALAAALLILAWQSVALAQNPATAKFPTAVVADQDTGVLCNSAHSQISAPVGPADMAVQVSSAASFCAPSFVTLEGGTSTSEVVKICSITSNTLNVCTSGRAIHGTAQSHSLGGSADIFIDSNGPNQLAAEVKAIETALGASLANVATSWGNISGKPSTFPPAAPTSSVLGGLFSFTAPAHQFLTSISTTGQPAAAQPAFSDISGSPTATQIGGAGTLTNGTSGNAATATALAATPTQCNTNLYATGVTAAGTANCSQVTYAQVGGTVPTWNQSTTGNAATATSVAWTGVTGRPTAVSAFTNDSGYQTSSGTVANATNASNASTVGGYAPSKILNAVASLDASWTWQDNYVALPVGVVQWGVFGARSTAATITSVQCFSDVASVQIQLRNSDGSDFVNGNATCNGTLYGTSNLNNGHQVIPAGGYVGMWLTNSVGATRVNVIITYTTAY